MQEKGKKSHNPIEVLKGFFGAEKKRGPREFYKIIENVNDTDLAIAYCQVHGMGYFERVDGSLFRCAHVDHKEGRATHIVDSVPGQSNHLQGT